MLPYFFSDINLWNKMGYYPEECPTFHIWPVIFLWFHKEIFLFPLISVTDRFRSWLNSGFFNWGMPCGTLDISYYIWGAQHHKIVSLVVMLKLISKFRWRIPNLICSPCSTGNIFKVGPISIYHDTICLFNFLAFWLY